MTAPLLQYIARFDGRGEIVGFGEGGDEKSWPWCSLFVGFPSLLSICCAKRLETSFTHVLVGDKPVHHFPRFRPHIFLRAKRCS